MHHLYLGNCYLKAIIISFLELLLNKQALHSCLTISNGQQCDPSYAGRKPEFVCQQVQRWYKEVVSLLVQNIGWKYTGVFEFEHRGQ